ncbi:esterase E4-like isoform X2 [Macrobrachium nipponense]|uniref:esterase E4-like isoform X2 n=1 Tax=Macrobrachium nipponense TaxID=159736 RepID=UPI0030C89653
MNWTMTSPVVMLLLLLHATGLAQGEVTAGEESVELLPSDVPMTMMERLTLGQDGGIKEFFDLRTSLGTITGLKEPTRPPHHPNTHMHAFRGIPYAKAPVGDLRFADPIDLVGPWPGNYLNASKLGSVCPQYDREGKSVLGDEDCLFLNVHTPSHLDEENRAEGSLLPVFVFIHGGGYIRGSSSPHGAGKLLSRDIIVVTINYRLGALGYLSMADSVLPGNYGFLDQVSALRWVQRNIAQFGGDPNQVTIGGFSAGGGAVHFHMHSPLSKGLFHRGIMLSGAASCAWALIPAGRDPLIGAQLLAQNLGCPSGNSKVLRECIASQNFKQIVKAQASLYKYEFGPNWFLGVIDGGLRPAPFLPAPLKELTLRPTPSLISVVPQEGLLFVATMLMLSENKHNATALYGEFARNIFRTWPDLKAREHVMDLAEAFYFSEHAKTSRDVFVEQLSEVITGYSFFQCSWEAAASIAESGAPVYTSVMTHRDPSSPTWAGPLYKKLKKMGIKTSALDTYVSHGDDLLYLFDFPYVLKEESSRDQRVGQMILQMWANFIITGDPQDDLGRFSLGDIPKWEPVVPHQPLGYYEIAVEPSMVHRPFNVKELNFWRNIVPNPDLRRCFQASQNLQDVNKQTSLAKCRSNEYCDL